MLDFFIGVVVGVALSGLGILTLPKLVTLAKTWLPKVTSLFKKAEQAPKTVTVPTPTQTPSVDTTEAK